MPCACSNSVVKWCDFYVGCGERGWIWGKAWWTGLLWDWRRWDKIRNSSESGRVPVFLCECNFWNLTSGQANFAAGCWILIIIEINLWIYGWHKCCWQHCRSSVHIFFFLILFFFFSQLHICDLLLTLSYEEEEAEVEKRGRIYFSFDFFTSCLW